MRERLQELLKLPSRGPRDSVGEASFYCYPSPEWLDRENQAGRGGRGIYPSAESAHRLVVCHL